MKRYSNPNPRQSFSTLKTRCLSVSIILLFCMLLYPQMCHAQFYGFPSHNPSTCSGWNVCGLCGGSGAVYWGYSGMQQCHMCGGNGRVKCPMCAGAEMAKKRLEQYEQQQWDTGWQALSKGRSLLIAGDDSNALKWFNRAYQLGETNACMWLGCMYELGMGCTASESKAREWYTRGNNTYNLNRIKKDGCIEPTAENRSKFRNYVREWSNRIAVDTYNFVNGLDEGTPSTIKVGGSSSSRTCNVCSGTGKCPTCRNGISDNQYTGGTFICPNCKSNPGNCSYCHGSGKLH